MGSSHILTLSDVQALCSQIQWRHLPWRAVKQRAKRKTPPPEIGNSAGPASWVCDLCSCTGPALTIMLCCCHFGILNYFWTRCSMFSLCPGSHILCGPSWDYSQSLKKKFLLKLFTSSMAKGENGSTCHTTGCSSNCYCFTARKTFLGRFKSFNYSFPPICGYIFIPIFSLRGEITLLILKCF